MGRGAKATGRAAVKGGRASARVVSKGTRAGTQRFRDFAAADGASATGLARLTELHALAGAADAAFTVSLASSVLAMPIGQARGQVALFLLTTMAPFVLLAPFIGPLLDEFRHGRRWAIGATLALRAFLSWVLAGLLDDQSAWLLPVALVCLLASRAYTVTRAAAIPLLLPESISLVTANARQSIAGVIGMVLGTALAAPVGRFGGQWSLRVAFLLYVVATIWAIRLPQHVDSPPPDAPIDAPPGRFGPARRPAVGPLPTSLRTTLAAATSTRVLAGFLTLFLAFLLREHPVAGISSMLLLGLVVAAAGVGNATGSFLGNRLGRHSPNRIATSALLVALGAALVTTLIYSPWTVVALGFVSGSAGALAKLCLDSLIQHRVPEHLQSRVFTRSETRLQTAWVVGGGLGIIVPLVPWVGFGLITVLLAAGVLAAGRIRAQARTAATPRPATTPSATTPPAATPPTATTPPAATTPLAATPSATTPPAATPPATTPSAATPSATTPERPRAGAGDPGNANPTDPGRDDWADPAVDGPGLQPPEADPDSAQGPATTARPSPLTRLRVPAQVTSRLRAPGSAGRVSSMSPRTPEDFATVRLMRSRRRRVVLRILLGLVVVLIVALVAGYQYAKPLLLTGTGYAAHNACAVVNVAGRSAPETDLPGNPLVPYLRTSPGNGSARTTILGVLAGQSASYTPGFGCTLAESAPAYGAATQVSAGNNPFTNAAAPGPDAALDAAVAAAFGDNLSAADKAALGTRAVVVVRDGRIVAERYAAGFTATTPQLGWSMGKSVANLLTGRLVAQGKVAITDSALRPEWTDDRRTITVDQLMRMSSGLSWDETYDLGTPITRMLYLEPDMAGYAASQPLAHTPGTYQQYSSGSTNILCSVLAQRAGVAADLPRRELFAPLGLTSAVWEADGVGTPVCSSYLWATPRDWAAVGQLALQDGVWNGTALLPQGWMTASTTAYSGDGEEKGYAAGWWVNKQADGSLVDPTLPDDAYWASGHDGQRVFVVPSARLVVVRLGFSPDVDAADLQITALVAQLAKGAAG